MFFCYETMIESLLQSFVYTVIIWKFCTRIKYWKTNSAVFHVEISNVIRSMGKLRKLLTNPFPPSLFKNAYSCSYN